MKHFLLLIFAFASVNLSAQIWADDFEDGDISDWTITDVDGDGFQWLLIEGQGTDGSITMASASWDPAVGPLSPDNFASSPAIDLTNETGAVFLAWDAYGQDQMWASENYQVWISTSTDPTEIAASGEMIFEETITAQGDQVWLARSVDISEYNGQVVHVTFRHTDVRDQFRMNLDNVAVLSPKGKDGSLSTVVAEKFYESGSSTQVSGTIVNQGLEAINSVTLGYSVNGGAMVMQTFDGLDIPWRGSFDYSFDEEIALDDRTDYFLNVTIVDVNGSADEVADNNVDEAVMYVVSEVPTKRLLLEEATGTWCTWCPRGAVILEMITEEFEDVIGVAVHRGDPMEIDPYGVEFAGLIPGYPSMLIDRQPGNVMPNSLATYGDIVAAVEESNKRISPASVNVTTTILPSGLMSVNVKSQVYAGLVGDYRLNAIVTEDGVTGTGDGINALDANGFLITDFDQVNAYADNANGPMGGYENLPNPVPATQMVYDHVAIGILDGFSGSEGSLPDPCERDAEYDYNFVYDLGADWMDRLENLHVIGMVIDMETGQVLNANTAMLPTDVEDVLAENTSVNVFPNPASNLTNIELTLAETETVSVELFNQLGQIVKVEDYGNLSGNQVLSLDLQNMEPGMYLIQMKIGQERYTHKLQIAE